MLDWKSFPTYNSETVSNTVPERPGVYLLWFKPSNSDWKCFYVGQSENLKSRLLEHLNSSEQNSCIKIRVSNYKCCFSFAETTNLDIEERRLITQYNPECNKVQSRGGYFI